MKRTLLTTAWLLLMGAGMLTSCSYTAEDYLDDMKELTEETLRNAPQYTEEDWKEVGRKYQEINAKGGELLKDMTKEQRKELKKMRQELTQKAAELDKEDIKKQLNELVDKADEALDNLLEKLND